MIKILFVDDNQSTVKVVKRKLTERGIMTLVAYEGITAIDLYAKSIKKPDIVFLDQLMPIMDGERAMQAILALNPEAKIIIMISGMVRDEVLFSLQVMSLKEKGATGLLVKPVTISNIEKKIAEFVL